MEIRQETYDDYGAVYQIVKDAFAVAEQSDGHEQDLVIALRNSRAFVPELSLVAVENGKVIGHILFTKVQIGKYIELALAPLAVHPFYQRKGIGLALIKKGHSVAKKLGYSYCVVLGHSKYYPKAGYVPASLYGIKAPFDVPNENFMAVKLKEGVKFINATVKYDEAFGIEG